MSDREDNDHRDRHARNGSMSGHSDEDFSERKTVSYRSRSKEGSKSASRSPHAKHSRYSRSSSRSGHRSRRSRSRNRSRSGGRRYSRSYRYSRSGSRSRSGSGGSAYRRRYRSHSRSPMSNRKRHNGTRVSNPKPSKCIGVFGLSIYTTETHLYHIFTKFGPVTKVQVVIDAKSGRSRGFAFVYFDNLEDAKNAKEQCRETEIDGRKIRVDYSITNRAHTPTPGIYMGKPTYTDMGGGGGGRWRGDDDYYGGRGGRYDRYRRTPSPYYSSRRRRHDRSRSRSYSPNSKYSSRYDSYY